MGRLARQRASGIGAPADFVFRLGAADADAVSLLVAGDTGEGDASQYAVVPGLLSQAGGVAAAVICSDVIYPAGEIGDYRDKFYRPYRDLRAPMLAMPGNHDWYDGLHGFMSHLCGIDAPMAAAPRAGGLRGLLTRLLWRKASTRARIATSRTCAVCARRPSRSSACRSRARTGRSTPDRCASSPSTPASRARSTPIRGAGCGDVSRADTRPEGARSPGKPIYVNGERHPCPIAGGGTVDDVVRDPAANYVAAIGGDIHNYQRYPVTLPDGRTLQYVVSGGGGAFMHATHQIPQDRPRGHDRGRLPLLSAARRLAGALLAPLRRQARRRPGNVLPDPGRGRHVHGRPARVRPDPRRARGAQPAGAARREASSSPRPRSAASSGFVSEAFDWNEPPLFKSFLRLDASQRALRVRCFGVSGCAGSEDDPPVEDEFTIGW